MIVFVCPNPACRKRYKVSDKRAGRTAACANPACRMRIQIPHPFPLPEPVPADLIDEETGALVKDWRDVTKETSRSRKRGTKPAVDATAPKRSRMSDSPDSPLESSAYRRRGHRKSIGQSNRIIAGIGSALLLIGLFLPMVNVPLGIWMSFVDLPWKAATIGLNVVAEAGERRGEPTQNRESHDVDRSGTKADGAAGLVTGVAAIGTLYPVCIFALIAVTFFQICGGTSRDTFTVTGGISFLATVLYGVALLALSTQKHFREVMIFTSPGFGWAVVMIGALAITGAGKIRSDSRN